MGEHISDEIKHTHKLKKNSLFAKVSILNL